MLHNPLITWLAKGHLTNWKNINPHSKDLWPLNLVGYWLQGGRISCYKLFLTSFFQSKQSFCFSLKSCNVYLLKNMHNTFLMMRCLYYQKSTCVCVCVCSSACMFVKGLIGKACSAFSKQSSQLGQH